MKLNGEPSQADLDAADVARFDQIFCAPAAPDREALRQSIANQSAIDGRDWERMLSDVDRLRSAIIDVPTPPALLANLLAIPETAVVPRHRSRIRELLQQDVGWKRVAALLLITLGIFAWANWSDIQQWQMFQPPALKTELAQAVAEPAVKHYHESPKLAVTSGDAAVVLAALQSHAGELGFTPTLPRPENPSLTLVGGGLTTFDGHPVAFTQWQSNGSQVLLYQLSEKSFDLPSRFATAVVAPPRQNANVFIHAGSKGVASILVSDEGCSGWLFCE